MIFVPLLPTHDLTMQATPRPSLSLLLIPFLLLGFGKVGHVFAEAQTPHLRLVWAQDLGDGKDVLAKGEELALMGYDNRDDHGVRVIMNGPDNFAKPLITPRGDQIVFTDRPANQCYVLGFDGTGQTPLATGFAAEVWRHPASGKQYVMVMKGARKVKALPGYTTITMVQLDNPRHKIPLWHGDLVAADNFQISADGSKAGGLFPWPHGGVADLASGTWTKLARGCWPSFAPDNSHAFWIFDGAHRNVFVHHGEREWKLPLHTAPGIGTQEVYHPRWANHPHYVVMTGPYQSGKLLEGGSGVEVYLGKMDEQITKVESWTRITENDRADFFPDAWISGGERVSLALSDGEGVKATVAEGGAKLVKGTLLEISPTPKPADILPYKRCLVAGHYKLEDGREVAALHWGIVDGKDVPGNRRAVGKSYDLSLVPFETRKDLRSERVSNHLEDFTLELYFDGSE